MENLAIANKGRSIGFISAQDFISERDGSGAFRAWLLAAHLYDLERDRWTSIKDMNFKRKSFGVCVL